MLKLSKVLALVVLLVFFVGGIALAISSPSSIYISDVYVFRGLLEPNDQLFYMRYSVNYNPDPVEYPSSTFLMAIYDGTTLKYTRPVNYYDHNIISIYLTSAQALTWGSGYIVKIMGSPAYFDPLIEGTNVASRGLGPGDYREINVLGSIMLAQAKILQDAWIVTLLTSSGLLNSTGSRYFKEAIPNLDSIVPDIFSAGVASYIVSRTNWTRANVANMTDNAGVNLTYVISGIGSIFGMSSGWSAFWLGGFVYLLVGAVIYSSTKNSMFAILIPFPLVGGMAWIGFGPSMLNLFAAIVIIVSVMFGITYILGKFA